MSTFLDENNCQGDAFSRLCRDDQMRILEYINFSHQVIPRSFRTIIVSYERAFDRVPTGLELIRNANKMLKKELHCKLQDMFKER